MKKQKDILLVLVTGFILTVLWVVFNIYHSTVTSTINEPLTTQIQEIDGSFDQETISQIKERQRVSGDFEIESTPTPTPEIEEISIEESIPSASESAENLQ